MIIATCIILCIGFGSYSIWSIYDLVLKIKLLRKVDKSIKVEIVRSCPYCGKEFENLYSKQCKFCGAPIVLPEFDIKSNNNVKGGVQL